jgi:hypothetical protein
VNAGEIIALASLIFTVFVFISGALIRSRDLQITDLKKQNESLEVKNDVLKSTLAAKQETIDEQHRQLDRLIITAEIQERFFSGLHSRLPPSATRDQS